LRSVYIFTKAAVAYTLPLHFLSVKH